MSGLKFSSSDEMNDRVIALINGAEPKDDFDRLALKEFTDVAAQGGVVVLAGDLPDPVEDFAYQTED